MRPAWLQGISSRRGARGEGRRPSALRRVCKAGLASAIALGGLVVFATTASAHDNIITAAASCNSPLGTGVTITWTIANDYNENVTGTVTSVTGGLSTLGTPPINFSIAASPGKPYSTTTLTQKLPASQTGVITLDINSTWHPDNYNRDDSGTFDLSTIDCSVPMGKIAGHIYLCDNGGNQTSTEVPGGTLGATGPQTVTTQGNPLNPTTVATGAYTMTATPPSGYKLVTCHGSSTPNGSGTSATESVTVPKNSTGTGYFYVTQVQTLAGHIYLCNAGTPTTTEVPGGTLAAGGSGLTTIAATANPLSATDVIAGTYAMTATNPSGYQLVACGGSSTPNGSGTSATESVHVPSGGAGVGVFYVNSVQTLAGHIYLCNSGSQTTTEVPGGTLAAGGSGLTTIAATANPLAATHVVAGTYTMTATTPSGYVLVACGGSSTPNGSGTSATESVTVPSLGAGVGVFYVSTIQTLAGHIYLCNAGSPTTTEVLGGTLAASGPTTVTATANPLAPKHVMAGAYTMTAANPSGYQLVACGGSSTPNGSGTSATESVTVPSLGAGVGVFYVSIQKISGHIYLCTNGSATTTEVPGGTLAAGGSGLTTVPATANPLSPTDVIAGTYTMTATSPADYLLVACGGSSTPDGSGSSATESVTVPSSGAGTGVFYVVPFSPSISVVKSADVMTVSAVGQTVTYSFFVTNTGNVPLTNVDVTDAQASPSLDSSLGPITCTTGTNGSITLAPEATDTCSATYTVTQADLANGSIADTATVTGNPPNQLPPVTDISSLALSVTSVEVVKAVSPSSGIVAGSTAPIVYTITVTNNGTATTTAPIVVTDTAPSNTTLNSSSPKCATGGPPTCTVVVSSGTITWTILAGVAPGASYTLTYSVTANPSDTAGTTITNTASWSGPSCGTPVAPAPVITTESPQVATPTTICSTNTVTTPIDPAPVTAATVTPPAATVTPPTATTTVPPKTSPAATPAIVFTGAFLSQEWMIGLGALLLGSGLVLVARRRRRNPRHAAK